MVSVLAFTHGGSCWVDPPVGVQVPVGFLECVDPVDAPLSRWAGGLGVGVIREEIRTNLVREHEQFVTDKLGCFSSASCFLATNRVE